MLKSFQENQKKLCVKYTIIHCYIISKKRQESFRLDWLVKSVQRIRDITGTGERRLKGTLGG